MAVPVVRLDQTDVVVEFTQTFPLEDEYYGYDVRFLHENISYVTLNGCNGSSALFMTTLEC